MTSVHTVYRSIVCISGEIKVGCMRLMRRKEPSTVTRVFTMTIGNNSSKIESSVRERVMIFAILVPRCKYSSVSNSQCQVEVPVH